MRILVAEDDPVSQKLLVATLRRWTHDVEVVNNGLDAWDVLQQPTTPRVAILDWMMPGLDGLEVCRRARELPRTKSVYLILLTARGEKDDLIAGLHAGANDYLTKPFDRDELRARLLVGERVVALQRSLEERVAELQTALGHIKRLQGILPICSYCKKIRDDQNYWQQVESYLGEHSEAKFSHGICPECWDSVVRPELEELGCDIPYPETEG